MASLGKARSVGILFLSIAALGEPQLSQRGKTVFPGFWTNPIWISGIMILVQMIPPKQKLVNYLTLTFH